jgi:O-antigen/teichoic acid export membrane protein
MQAMLLWVVVPTPVMAHVQLRRWKYMMSDSTLLWGASLLLIIVTQSSYLILGALHAQEAVGLYFFAYNLSTQTMQLLVANVAHALFPALSQLQHNPARQHNAFIRASKSLAMLALPACLLQAALAGPLVRVFFDQDKEASIPVFQVLSVGMAFVVLSGPVVSLLKAQGRFATYFWWQFWCALGSLALVTASEHALQKTLSVFLPPLIGSMAALAPGLFLLRTLPHTLFYDVVAIAIVSAIAFALYSMIMRYLSADSYRETMSHVLRLLSRFTVRQA